MAIENRDLAAGTRLVGRYKKQDYACTVEADPEGEGIVFRLEDGKTFRSLSAAGSAVMGGAAVNGWRFWSLEGETQATQAAPAPVAEAKGRGKEGGRKRRLIYRVPNQQGTPEGKQKFFCSACMKGFVVDAGETPEVCPQGHRNDDPELTGNVGAPEKEVEA